MNTAQHTKPSCHRGSKALAVLSCALALLAAHPLAAQVIGQHETAAVRTVSQTPAVPAPATQLIQPSTTPDLASPRTLATHRRDAHDETPTPFLTAFDHLRAFLLTELAPLLATASPDFLPEFNRVTLDAPTKTSPTAALPAPAVDLPQARERAFAIARCLLAPPC